MTATYNNIDQTVIRELQAKVQVLQKKNKELLEENLELELQKHTLIEKSERDFRMMYINKKRMEYIEMFEDWADTHYQFD